MVAKAVKEKDGVAKAEKVAEVVDPKFQIEGGLGVFETTFFVCQLPLLTSFERKRFIV